MEKSKIVVGVLSTIALFTGVFFHIMHFPGAGMLMVAGMLSFAGPFMFMFTSTRIKQAKTAILKTTYGMIGLVTSIFTLGALFKIQHWPGALVVLGASVALAVVVVIPLLLINRKNLNQAESIGMPIVLFYMSSLLIYVLLAQY